MIKELWFFIRMELVRILWWNKDVIVVWPSEDQFDSNHDNMTITGEDDEIHN